MTKAERVALIEAVEQTRDSCVIAYVTADRGVAHAPIAEEILRIAYDHARHLAPEGKALDLFLYSRGGDMMLPWPFVTTLRSLFPSFRVLIPFKAHSAATFISLGADQIVMTPIAQLTPVEPTVTMPFNPVDPTNPGNRLGINVEDVAAYFEFVGDRAGIDSESGQSAALTALTAQVNPVALGHVHRFHKLARLQSEKLLSLHMTEESDKPLINDIAESLVTRLFAHEYRIGREEARELGLKAVDATDEENQAIWALFEAYEESMELRKPVLPSAAVFSPGEAHADMDNVKLSYMESRARTDVFVADFEFTRIPAQTPPGQTQRFGPQVQMTIVRQEWETE
jgi:hypothetical protein